MESGVTKGSWLVNPSRESYSGNFFGWVGLRKMQDKTTGPFVVRAFFLETVTNRKKHYVM